MLLDKFIAQLPRPLQPELSALLAAATILKIQNVADYYYRGTPQEEWSVWTDFPQCAPPWPVIWMEWHGPQEINSNGVLIPTNLQFYRFGVLLKATKFSTGEWGLTITCISPSFAPGVFHGIMGEIKLVVNAQGIPISMDKVLDGVPGFKLSLLNKVLQRDYVPQGTNTLVYAIPNLRFTNYTKEDYQAVLDTKFLFPVLLALSFCHCKNVTLQETGLSIAHQKARCRKSKLPIEKFYTLQIEPMQRLLHQAHATDLKLALHICRGHFKDYREGAGLFGKRHDLYWWDMQVRGSATEGTVKKDYEVNPQK